MMRMPAAPVIVAAASPDAAVATSAAADSRPTAASSATASPVNVLHDAASDGSEPYSSYSSSPFMSVRRATNNTGTNNAAAATNTNSTNSSTSIGTNSANANANANANTSTSTSTSVEPRHPTHRRLAPAPPPPPPPTAANSRHPDALRFPPSPSPTPSHPTLTSSSSNYSNASHTASERPSCRPAAPKPGQCPVMALQNVLCDDDVDAATDAARRTASRPSQPPTPPMMHDASVSILPVPVPHPAASHVLPPGPMPSSLTLNPILSGHDGPDPMIVARPNPSHVVMTARPQLQPRVQPTDPGCKTCQVRKMPCDESRPTCLNCSRMGINCLGYHDSPPSHVQMTQPSDRPVPGPSVVSNTSTSNGNASASRQEQEEYLYYLLDHYRHTKRHCMWDLITLDFNEHFQAKMRKEALQMIKRRRFKDRETREPSPNEPTAAGVQLPPRPRQKKRGRRPKFSPTIPPNMRESGTESGTG